MVHSREDNPRLWSFSFLLIHSSPWERSQTSCNFHMMKNLLGNNKFGLDICDFALAPFLQTFARKWSSITEGWDTILTRGGHVGLQLIRGHHQVPKEEIENASQGDESRYIWPKSMTVYHQGKVGRIYLGAQFCIWDHVWSRIGGHCSSIYNNKRINIVVRATLAYLHNIGDKGLLGCLPSSLTRNMMLTKWW